MATSGRTSSGGDTPAAPGGELRAFVLVQHAGHSWVVDLVPAYELVVGSGADADLRLEGQGVASRHATITWNGREVTVAPAADDALVHLDDSALTAPTVLHPGDEIVLGAARLVVSITLAPTRMGRRSLTHQEFCERVGEELGRAARSGRNTCFVMLKSRSGDGSSIASAALGSFREGDIVGTYAHDEIEFLLPDTPPRVAKAVVERLVETSGGGASSIGMAVAPDDGDDVHALVRAGREALAAAVAQGGGFARAGNVAFEEATTGSVRTEATRQLVEQLTEAAREGDSVLLVGEPNSGRRHFARILHDRSPRSAGPFVVIQCGGLVDSEAIKRAFGGGADDAAQGMAATARGGTLALDEVGDLPLQGQRRLERFLDGDPDFNIVSTTHRELSALCEVGGFLDGLYEKLSGRVLRVPALRMRADSIVPLAKNFAKRFKSDRPVKLSPEAIDRMRSYSWPGNVLELRNAIERAVALADGGEILAEHLPGDMAETGEGRLRDHVGSVERSAIIKALADNNYNQTHAAKLLGISRRALIYKMEKYGLKPPPGGARGR